MGLYVRRREVLTEAAVTGGLALGGMLRPFEARAQPLAFDTQEVYNKVIAVFRKGTKANTSSPRMREFRDPSIPTSILEATAREDVAELGRIKKAKGLISTFLEGESKALTVAVIFRNQGIIGQTIPENQQLCIAVMGLMENGDDADAWYGWPLKDLIGTNGYNQAKQEIEKLGYFGLAGRAIFDGKDIKKEVLGFRKPGLEIPKDWTPVGITPDVSQSWIHKPTSWSQTEIELNIGSVMANLACTFIGRGGSSLNVASKQ
jgi:hypothetical protein